MLSPTRLYILLVVLMLLVGIVFIYVLIRRAGRKSAQKEAEAGAADKGDAGKTQPSLHGSSVWLKLSFRRAMRSVRAYGKGSLYRIPWYLMVGEAQSGKTTALGSTGLDLLSEEPDEEKAGVKQGVNWFFFDQGIVLDVAGDLVLRADGATSNDRSWEYLLKLLRRHRPERPLDGIILTIPCPDLVGAQKADPASKLKLEQKADLLYANLVEARKTLGLNLPVYVLVTKCDEVMGFRSLCNEIPGRLDEMFGWSSPYTREMAYRSEWVTEAFQTLYRYLFYLQMEIFAARSHVINSDELFMLPSEMRAMRRPLQIYLDQIFKESAYHDAFFLRGIYFCGDSAGGVLPSARALPGPAEPEIDWLLPPPNPSRVVAPEPATAATPAGRKPAFLGHLFERKIFQEDSLARPVSRTSLSRNKVVRVAQALALAIPLVGALGILATYSGLKAREREFYKFLTREEQDLREIRAEKLGRVDEERARYREANLFEAMSGMSGRSLASPFIPGSWFSSVGENSGQSISSAYPYVVLDSLRRRLDCRTENLLPRDPDADCSAALGSYGGPVNVLDNCGPGDTQSDYSISAFVEGLDELIQNRARYNRLAKDGGSLDDLNKLLLYLNHAPVPADFDPRNSLFVKAVGTATQRGPLRATDQSVYDRAACRFEGWAERIYDESFRDKRVLYGRRAEIAKALALLSRPENAWLATRRFSDSSPLEGTYPEGLGELNRALTDLYNERFMSPDSGARPGAATEDEPELAHAARVAFAWDKNSLQQAIALYNDYANFVKNKTYNRADTLDYQAKRAALNSLTRKLAALVRQAQVRPPPPAPLPGETNQRAGLRAAVKNFVDVQEQLAQLLDICRKLNIDVGLRGAVFDQVKELMREIDYEFVYGGFYEQARDSFSWWTLERPFHAYTMFGVANADELESYLARQRESIAELARQYAAPLINFMASQGVILRSPSVDWAGLLDQLEKFEARKPGNTVGVLEEFIRDMEKVKLDDCPAIMADSTPRPADFFIRRRDALREPFFRRCDELYGEKIAVEGLGRSIEELAEYEERRSEFFKSLKNYTDLEDLFNKTLAGRFPFSTLPQSDSFEEADPESIDAFFELLGKNQAAAEAALKQAKDYHIAATDALRFLEEMAKVQAFFSSFVGKKPPYPTFDLSVAFRVNKGVREIGANQIIDWAFTVGTKRIGYQDKDKTAAWGYADPLTLTMRWASDSPILPGSTFRPLSNMSANGRVVTLSYSNNWSLLLLILRQKGTPGDFAPRLDLEPHTLKVSVPVRPNAALPANVQSAQPESLENVMSANPPQVVAFMRVAMMLPGKKEPLLLPAFPTNAPQLRYKDHTLVRVEQE